MGDIQELINEYEWLLTLNDDNLSQEVIQTNNVQNALMELLRFANKVMDLPKL